MLIAAAAPLLGLASQQHQTHPQPALIIEPAGKHAFSYTALAWDTGQMLWRWPREAPPQDTPQVRGQIVDVSI